MKQAKFKGPPAKETYGIAYDGLYEIFIIAVNVGTIAYIIYLALYIDPRTIN